MAGGRFFVSSVTRFLPQATTNIMRTDLNFFNPIHILFMAALVTLALDMFIL
jgi:hypothetical protein